MHITVDNQNKIGKTLIENKALNGYLDPKNCMLILKVKYISV